MAAALAIKALSLVLLAASALPASPAPASPLVFPWICLERCGDNATAIAAQVAQAVAHAGDGLTGVSFEDYGLSPTGSLVKVSNLTQVAPSLSPSLQSRLAMVSSFPYPSDFLTYMRAAFANPAPFIAQALAAARAENLTGFCIDWEPGAAGPPDPAPTAADAVAYASFLSTFADAMHDSGLTVLVAAARWSRVWNYSLLGASSVDWVASMGTYTANEAEWGAELAALAAAVPAAKAVVGLETLNSTTGLPYPEEVLAARFAAIKAAGLRSVGLWRAPVPDSLWPFLRSL